MSELRSRSAQDPMGGSKTGSRQARFILSRLMSIWQRIFNSHLKVEEDRNSPVLPFSDGVRDARGSIHGHKASDVARYYDQWTQSYIDGFGEVFQGARPESTGELLDYIIHSARLEDGFTVLDAGCGVCGPALWFAESKNLRVEALTISEVQVVEAQERINSRGLQDRVLVRQGDFHRLAEIYPSACFDRVLFLESLCHAENYRSVLQQAKQVLKAGGCVYIKDFYVIDNRSRPEVLKQQAEDLLELNKVYCLMMPDLPRMVDTISELGYDIIYMRKPLYTYSPAPWQKFMEKSKLFWLPKQDAFLDISTIEFLISIR